MWAQGLSGQNLGVSDLGLTCPLLLVLFVGLESYVFWYFSYWCSARELLRYAFFVEFTYFSLVWDGPHWVLCGTSRTLRLLNFFHVHFGNSRSGVRREMAVCKHAKLAIDISFQCNRIVHSGPWYHDPFHVVIMIFHCWYTNMFTVVRGVTTLFIL